MSLAIAVSLTWVFFIGLFMLVGLWTTALVTHINPVARIRIALWLGLAQVTILLIALHFFLPLGRSSTLWSIVGLALISGVLWVLLLRQRTPTRLRKKEHRWFALWTLIPSAVLLLSVLVFAHFFAGPLGNYDAGLYHINAIQYSAEFPTIPGLANLHSRLGTNTTSSLISAALAATPWGIEAFRLLVGLFMVVFITDLILRLVETRRTPLAPGTILMLLATAWIIPFLLAEPEGLVTSPTSDPISMLVVLAATAYFLDAVWTRNLAWSTVAVVIAVLAATMRTQVWVFTVLMAAALIAHAWRAPQRAAQWRTNRAFIAVGGVISLLLTVGMLLRDAILSGWLLFPASLFPVPVEWRVADPSGARDWILSWAREPEGNPEVVLNSWSWLGPWISRSATDSAIQLMVGALLAAALLWLFMRFVASPENTNKKFNPRLGAMGLALLMLPVIASLGVWFFTAPDPRFAWGSLLTLGLIPLSIAITRLATLLHHSVPTPALTAVVASFMTLLIAGPALSSALNIKGYIAEGYELRTYSFGPFTVTAHVNPVEAATVVEFQLNDGNVILTPTQDDRCHLSFPACRPYPDPTLQFRGDSIADGFLDGSRASH